MTIPFLFLIWLLRISNVLESISGMGLINRDSKPELQKIDDELNLMIDFLEKAWKVLKGLIQWLDKKHIELGIALQTLHLGYSLRMEGREVLGFG